MRSRPNVTLHSFDRRRDGASFSFSGLMEEVTARSLDEVIPALRKIEEGVDRGLHAAGFISYEAAPGLGTALPARPPGPLPLLWFGLFQQRSTVAPREPRQPAATSTAGEWRSSLDAENYAGAVARIRDYIAAGDAYQVNFTFRRRFRYTGDPALFYRKLCAAQAAPFSAYIDTGRFQVLSASPELFFHLDKGVITVRPMKGTAPRGRWWDEDEAAKQQLRDDPKERAENLMIVDLMRNDLGMIAVTGSVRVASLFDIETLPTLHQMTSTVTAELKAGNGIVEIFRALFPCGSVTGAPKKRSMEIIAELEDSPRGIYTGCIGYISPKPASGHPLPTGEGEMSPLSLGERDGVRECPHDNTEGNKATSYEAVFNVAIRTAVIDSETGDGELGVGSGITWDSSPAAEYAECLAKGEFALMERPRFRLVETMLFTGEEGYFLLDRHLERLRRSAAYFGFTFRPAPVRKGLEQSTANLSVAQKVRLLLDRRGGFTINVDPIPPAPDEIIAVAFAGQHTDSRDPFLYHKTDHRDLYREELARRPDCTDVIFRNERGEVTEGVNHNLVARIGGALVTPALSCGLLPGVFREELLKRGEIAERVITMEELAGVEEIWLVNSVRKWRRARLV